MGYFEYPRWRDFDPRAPTCTETLSHHLSGMQRTKKVPSSIRTFKSGIGMRKT